MNLSIIFAAEEVEIPDYHDEILFLYFKNTMLEILDKGEIVYFGYAPDNTADCSDELLNEGTYFRIIASEEMLNVNIDSKMDDVIKSFKKIVEEKQVAFGCTITEKGFIKTETTIEFIF